MASDQSKRSSAEAGPIGTVFGTTELVEAVLLQVDHEDIMKCRRINRFVNGVIAGSRKLQRKIFAEQILPQAGHAFENIRNELLFPSVWDSASFQHQFRFRVKSDPGFAYATASTPARDWIEYQAIGEPKLTISRVSAWVLPDAMVVPDAYLDSFICSHAGAMPVVPSGTAYDEGGIYEAPAGTTLRDLSDAVKDWEIDGMRGRGIGGWKRLVRDEMSVWEHFFRR